LRAANPDKMTIKSSRPIALSALTLVLSLLGLGQNAMAQSTWLLGGGGSWNAPTNWSSGTIPNSAGTTAVLGSSITNNSTVTVGSNVVIGNLTFNDNNNYLVTNNSISFSQPGGSTILVTNVGTNNLRSAVVLSNDLTVSQWSTGTFTIGGARSGSGNLIKEGTGTLLLTNSSSVVGELRVNNGRVTLGAGNPIAAGSLVKVGDGTGSAGSASLFLDASTGSGFAPDVVVASDGLLWQGNNRLVRVDSLSGVGETRLNTAVGNGFDFNGNGVSNNSTYDGVITGGMQVANMDRASGSRINKTGTSTLTLTASNSFVARAFIADGTLVVANNNALGLGTAMSNATYVSGFGNVGLISNVTVAEPLYLNSRGSELGAVHSLSGSNRLTGPISMGWSGGAIVATNGSVGAAAGSVLVITSGITGTNASSGMFKLGAGTVILEGASSFTGSTVVEAGTLSLASTSGPALAGNLSVINGETVWRANDQVATNRNITLAGTNMSSAIANLNGFSNTVTSLAINNGTLATGTGRLTAGTVTSTNGVISGNLSVGGLTKSGGGTLTIAASTGVLASTSSVTGGWLTVAGSLGGLTTVTNTGTISGTGTVSTLNIASGGTLSPGNSPGTLTATNGSSWLSGGSYVWEINDVAGPAGTTWDLLDVTAGNLDLSGITNVGGFTIFLTSLTTNNTPGATFGFNPLSTYTNWLIASATNITGFSAANFTINTNSFVGAGGGEFGIEWRTSPGNQGLYLMYQPSVPEPGTWAAAAVCALIAGLHQWHRRRK
jgi:autotransporter-associated beta strand protein